MKCPNCGYIHGYEWVDDEYVKVDGDEGDFFTISNNIYAQRPTGRHWEHDSRNLFGCPKCNIVFIESKS